MFANICTKMAVNNPGDVFPDFLLEEGSAKGRSYDRILPVLPDNDFLGREAVAAGAAR